MNSALGSVDSGQQYRAVKDEDFDDITSEESHIQRRNVLVTTHERRQRPWYWAARFLVSSEVLLLHFAWLLILIFSISCLRYSAPSTNCAVSGLPSDQVFGEIPYRIVNWKEDKAFVNSDPMDGKRWNFSRRFGIDWTPWDDIHPGSWVKVKPSSKLGISGGMPLREYSRDQTWDTEEEGYALSMHHQIHCLGLMKHVFIKAERKQTLMNADFRHMDHCVEYLRQAIMCNGDLTLEPLGPNSTRTVIESDTWGSKHYCRDWNVLKEVLTKFTTVGIDKDGYTYDQAHP